MQRRRALLLQLVVVAGACSGAEDDAVDPARIDALESRLAEADARVDAMAERIAGLEARVEAQDRETSRLLEAALATPRAPDPSPPAASGPAAPSEERLRAGIACAADRCTLERALVDELLADPSALARSARIVPLIEEGRPRGFKLYGMRPGSLGALLGLQNGDALVSIDGRPLDSLESALERYSSLRGAKRVELGYERRGEARALTLVLD